MQNFYPCFHNYLPLIPVLLKTILMKYPAFYLSIVLIIFSCQLKGQEKTEIEPIHKIIVSSGILLQIEKAPEYTLTIKTQDLESKCLVREIENGVLTLKLLNGFGCSGKVMATLTCPTISSMEIMGKAEVSTKGLLITDSLRVKLQSGGKAYIDLDIKYLEVIAGGGSTFYAEGYAERQKIHVSVSASFSGHKLEGEFVSVEASLSGMAKVCATEKLDVAVGSNSYVSYACDPVQIIQDVRPGGILEEASEE